MALRLSLLLVKDVLSGPIRPPVGDLLAEDKVTADAPAGDDVEVALPVRTSAALPTM